MSPQGPGGAGSVYLHVGEPKTGTTYLQQVLWTNKDELASSGVIVPGPRPLAHWRAAQDLREVPQIPNDPVGPHAGAWDRLCRQALRAPRTAIISHELLSAVTEEQAARGIRSLAPATVHVILTVRDMGSLLPAEWQETVKHRNARMWEDWLGDVIDREADDPDRRRFLFWRMHDTLEILRIWGSLLPPEQVHVITTPPRDSSRGLLWERFAQVIGVDPGAVETERARSNTSLGVPEVELLRRVNVAMPAELPDWFYMRNVKDLLAHRALAVRPRTMGRLELPPERDKWARHYAEELVAQLAASSYDVVGELAELLPRPVNGPVVRPSDATADDMLDSAIIAITALLTELSKLQGIGREPAAAPTTASAPGPIKRRLIGLAERNQTMHRLRRQYWHIANAAKQVRMASRADRGRTS